MADLLLLVLLLLLLVFVVRRSDDCDRGFIWPRTFRDSRDHRSLWHRALSSTTTGTQDIDFLWSLVFNSEGQDLDRCSTKRFFRKESIVVVGMHIFFALCLKCMWSHPFFLTSGCACSGCSRCYLPPRRYNKDPMEAVKLQDRDCFSDR